MEAPHTQILNLGFDKSSTNIILHDCASLIRDVISLILNLLYWMLNKLHFTTFVSILYLATWSNPIKGHYFSKTANQWPIYNTSMTSLSYSITKPAVIFCSAVAGVVEGDAHFGFGPPGCRPHLNGSWRFGWWGDSRCGCILSSRTERK